MDKTEELLLHVLSFMKQRVLLRVARTSRRWMRLCFHTYLWQHIDVFFDFQYGVLPPPRYCDNKYRLCTCTVNLLSILELRLLIIQGWSSLWCICLTHWLYSYAACQACNRPFIEDFARRLHWSHSGHRPSNWSHLVKCVNIKRRVESLRSTERLLVLHVLKRSILWL